VIKNVGKIQFYGTTLHFMGSHRTHVPFLVKEDAMKAAAGVFFQTHSGPTDACKKLSLGDPQKATPHIIYYLHNVLSRTPVVSCSVFSGG
jgi:hypothetical protein